MKKYIVVKTNLMRNQRFYKRHKKEDSWSVNKEDAHKYASRRTAEKIAKAKASQMNACWRDIIKYEVEEVVG